MTELVKKIKRNMPEMTVERVEHSMEITILIMIFITSVLAIAPIV